jgi:hypothetical protein
MIIKIMLNNVISIGRFFFIYVLPIIQHANVRNLWDIGYFRRFPLIFERGLFSRYRRGCVAEKFPDVNEYTLILRNSQVFSLVSLCARDGEVG